MCNLRHTLAQLLYQKSEGDASWASVAVGSCMSVYYSSLAVGDRHQISKWQVGVSFTWLDLKGQAPLWGGDLTTWLLLKKSISSSFLSQTSYSLCGWLALDFNCLHFKFLQAGLSHKSHWYLISVRAECSVKTSNLTSWYEYTVWCTQLSHGMCSPY